MTRLLLAFLALFLPAVLAAQDLPELLDTYSVEITKPSRKSVGPVLEALVSSGLPDVPVFLQRWQDKDVYRLPDGRFAYVEGAALSAVETGETLPKEGAKQLKPNGGVRRRIGEALVRFQLSDPDPKLRSAALDVLARGGQAQMLAPLKASIAGEPDVEIRARKERLAGYLTARFGETTWARVEAVQALGADMSVEARAVLSQLLRSEVLVLQGLPENANVARELVPGRDMSEAEAYSRIVAEGGADAFVTDADVLAALNSNVTGGRAGGVPLASMDNWPARYKAYDRLADEGVVPPRVTPADMQVALNAWRFVEVYAEPDLRVTQAARASQDALQGRLALSEAADLGLDALSLASIYFLAAIGLAITFGVMGVINMAHGEFIMMGAYTGYVVQLFIPDYTLSLFVALPLAFATTFAAGVAMERLVIRWLYDRPLETLLATFGISIALQQLAKNIFGTQARPLTSPAWLDGAWVINEVVSISFIRIAIFGLALIFLGLLLFILNKTRLGLEVRAVTQNPRMAASMGINPERIKMMTFGLGSGIAGIAGVAIGLYAKVTSEMGADYIVQSFMTVVVGGVGNVWGTLLGAGMIGTLQKGIEWLYPSNTLAAQTYMILFIILFIQFRPKGIIALKGRAAGD